VAQIPGLRSVPLDDRQRTILIDRRMELGLTHAQLGNKVGLKAITIHTIESGKYLPSTIVMEKLCRVLSLDCEIVIEVNLFNSGTVTSAYMRATIHQRRTKKATKHKRA
jgi:DNA-binding XRE family transcriptional regulator